MSALPTARTSLAQRNAPQPDPDIECMVTLQPVRPVTAGALAAGLHARVGKPLRWFGRRGEGLPWQLLKSDTAGDFSEIVACLLLADRTGAATQPVLDAFVRLTGDIAAMLPAAYVPPDTTHEAARAETLDRICADLDVQIGLTVLKAGPATILGTRLRGVAEAAGFRLAEGGRFDWVQERRAPCCTRCRTTAPSRSPPTRCGSPRPPARSSCSTFPASPSPCASSTR
jgi:hypothetical protein